MHILKSRFVLTSILNPQRAVYFVVILGLFLTSPLLSAQDDLPAGPELDKQELKALKKEIKELSKNPEVYYQMKKQDADLANALQSKSQELQTARDQQTELSRELSKKDDAIAYLEEQLRRLVAGANSLAKCTFSVQIGAYQNQDLSQYANLHPNFRIETDADGFKKYTLGFFNAYWEAKNFSDFLNNRGAQTYVVGFYEGERIPDLKDMSECTF